MLFRRGLMLIVAAGFLMVAGLLEGQAAGGQGQLGAADFRPSAEQPVGWRGDGTGRFPDAAPPLAWGLKKDGSATNILWQSEMPYYSPSSPIVVGDRLFTTANAYSLVCVDTANGKILWVRSVSPYDAATKEERAAHKEVFDQLDALALKRDELNAKIPAAPADGVFKLGQEVFKVEEQMEKLICDSDKEKYRKTGMSYSDGGYMAATPASDGTCVYAWNGWGVTACFDLKGERKWIRFDQIKPQEHGHFSAPLLIGEKVIIYIGRQFLALDKATGAEVWRSPYFVTAADWSGYWYGSHIKTQIGGEDVIVAGDGSLVRVRDGERFVKGEVHQGAPAPLIAGDQVVWIDGPMPPGFRAYRLPEKVDSPFAPRIQKHTFEPKDGGFMQSSPLFVDGLLYVLGSNPILYVFDVAANQQVYSQRLDFGELPKRADRPYGCGICGSPALAGGKVFITGNFGTTLILEPGREYKEIGRNTIEKHFPYDWKPDMLEGFSSNAWFQGNRMYYRAQKYLYCVGG